MQTQAKQSLRNTTIEVRQRGAHASHFSSAPLGVAVARVSRAAQTRLESSARRRCSAGGLLANREGERFSKQRLILEALSDTRAALSEILRIDLGTRYQLQLEISDWEGWPRLELRLIDSLTDFIPGFRGVVKEHLSSGAIERSGRGMIFLALNYREVLAQFVVSEERDLEALPQAILEAVQHFLGRVTLVAHEQPERCSLEQSKPVSPPLQKSSARKARPHATVQELPKAPSSTSIQEVDRDVNLKLAELNFFSD